ncbi:MAG: hypothetical protein U1E23_13335 [Reyranellaceae bacterium]
MTVALEADTENEPPDASSPTDAAVALLRRAGAGKPVSQSLHAVVIGHRTLPFVLALLEAGCTAVRSLRLDAPAPDREMVDLAWVVGVRRAGDLAIALHAARARIGRTGVVAVEGALGSAAASRSRVRFLARREGLVPCTFDASASSLVLEARAPLALAA